MFFMTEHDFSALDSRARLPLLNSVRLRERKQQATGWVLPINRGSGEIRGPKLKLIKKVRGSAYHSEN